MLIFVGIWSVGYVGIWMRYFVGSYLDVGIWSAGIWMLIFDMLVFGVSGVMVLDVGIWMLLFGVLVFEMLLFHGWDILVCWDVGIWDRCKKKTENVSTIFNLNKYISRQS